MASIPRIKYLNRSSDLVGEQVFVYRNLHRNCWSLRSKRTGRVIAHVDHLRLADARFLVSEAGRQRVLQEKKKNVHAGIQGRIEPLRGDDIHPWNLGDSVTYNPYKRETFYNKVNEKSIHRSPDVVLFDRLVFAK
tara:strand:+ start:719 stop:1123 length:405 start_codon:yes stop_codon:yes gene_type:complete